MMKAGLALLLVLSISDGSAPAGLRLPYLATPPVIDGALDAGLERLPSVDLVPGRPGVSGAVRMRAAHGGRFLYLHLRSEQPALQCRDRAYQNGDGLVVVLATRSPDGGPSRRFRVAAFSPQPEGRRNWQFAFTWYRDTSLVMAPIEGAQFRWITHAGGVELEVLLPWQSLAPYHPWLDPEMGLNVAFVRAVKDGGTESFLLSPDDRIQSEQSPRRYLPVSFDPPPGASPPSWFARVAEGHPERGRPIALDVAGLDPTGGMGPLSVRVLGGEGEPVLRRRLDARPGPTLRSQRVYLPDPLPPGGYTVEISGGADPPLRWGLTVLPEGGVARLRGELERLSTGRPPGTVSTLTFRLEDARRELEGLQATDPAGAPRVVLEALADDLSSLSRGVDPVARATGLLRRAYRSRVDGTLQPYTLRVPEGVKPGERRPLLVFLHGSGQDDRGILDSPRAPAGWFELAPRGRGTSNCFSAERAQDDLRESIEDVVASYPVDPGRIVLAGFSMGGYGVYRTAFERSGFFRGLAVFSGVPDVATRWLGPGHPDFLDPSTHGAFRGVPMFVFHGTEDRNCPFEKTVELVDGLRRSGARVDFVTEKGKGHEAPSEATLRRYFTWLEEVVQAPGN